MIGNWFWSWYWCWWGRSFDDNCNVLVVVVVFVVVKEEEGDDIVELDDSDKLSKRDWHEPHVKWAEQHGTAANIS